MGGVNASDTACHSSPHWGEIYVPTARSFTARLNPSHPSRGSPSTPWICLFIYHCNSSAQIYSQEEKKVWRWGLQRRGRHSWARWCLGHCWVAGLRKSWWREPWIQAMCGKGLLRGGFGNLAENNLVNLHLSVSVLPGEGCFPLSVPQQSCNKDEKIQSFWGANSAVMELTGSKHGASPLLTWVYEMHFSPAQSPAPPPFHTTPVPTPHGFCEISPGGSSAPRPPWE